MCLNPAKISMLLILLPRLSPVVYAADTAAVKYPVVILVQLPTEQNRIVAMTKAKRFKEIEEVQHDADNVRKRIIHDFTGNFDYCPVYFYIDTNEDLVRQKNFDGIILNADGSSANNRIINSNSSDYAIVYYGYALSQSRRNPVVTDSNKYFYDPDSPPGKGLIVLNDKFQQISYVFRLSYSDMTEKDKKIEDYYVSRHYDIEYYPLAKLFNKKLHGKRGHKNKIKSARYNG